MRVQRSIMAAPVSAAPACGGGSGNEPRTQENQIRRYHVAVVACFREGVPFQRGLSTCCDTLLLHVTASPHAFSSEQLSRSFKYRIIYKIICLCLVTFTKTKVVDIHRPDLPPSSECVMDRV
jgi:hypothetical protein